MKEIKIKLKESDKEVKLCFTQNKQVIKTETRYVNKCIICKKATLDQLDFGEKHICPECLETIKKDFQCEFPEKKKTRKKAVKKVNSEETKQEVSKYTRDLSMFAQKYRPSIRIIDYTKYKNLMSREMKERTATTIIDLILKGNNTVKKIVAIAGVKREETVYAYFTILAKVGMLCPVGKLTRGNRFSRLYRVNSTLEYVNI